MDTFHGVWARATACMNNASKDASIFPPIANGRHVLFTTASSLFNLYILFPSFSLSLSFPSTEIKTRSCVRRTSLKRKTWWKSAISSALLYVWVFRYYLYVTTADKRKKMDDLPLVINCNSIPKRVSLPRFGCLCFIGTIRGFLASNVPEAERPA